MRAASKKLRLFFAFFIICIMPVSAAFAEIKVLEKEIEEIVGKNQSQEQVEAFALEVEHENQRLFPEEQRLKAQKDIAKADIETLRQEQERSARFARLQKEQESARKKELEEIARGQDRIRKAQLENESYWKELARKAELSQAEWIAIDDTLSLKQAVEEAKNLRAEIADMSSRLDFQLDSSKKNLEKAYKQQIAVTGPILPPDPAPKDAFETSDEYNLRLEGHKEKVHKAGHENKEKIKELKKEGDLKIAQLRVSAFKHSIQVLEPFVHRLKTLQSKRFGLPDKKVKVTLGDPDADNSRFPIHFEYNGKKWSKYWKYQYRKEARAFWKTRSHLVAQALFQLEGASDKITYRLTAIKVSHPGTKDERIFELEMPTEFDEIAAWNRGKTVKLAQTEKDEKIAHLKNSFVDPVTGMEFVYVPGGCFQLGCGSWAGNCDSDEKPVHEVCVDGFLIGKYEVTQGQWREVMGWNPSCLKNGDDYPVENVSWNDAQKFIRKLSALNNNKYKFRLPTEAEWEYACRSGGKPETYSGSDRIDRVAWYSGNSGGRTHRVGTKGPNGLGLYDMSGNVWELCQDWYGDYPSDHVIDPKGPFSGSYRVCRGGSWGSGTRYCRSAFRRRNSPGGRRYDLGFRLARTH